MSEPIFCPCCEQGANDETVFYWEQEHLEARLYARNFQRSDIAKIMDKKGETFRVISPATAWQVQQSFLFMPQPIAVVC